MVGVVVRFHLWDPDARDFIIVPECRKRVLSGQLFYDGSCLQRHHDRPFARAGWAVCQVDDEGNLTAYLNGPVPEHEAQHSQAGERIVAKYAKSNEPLIFRFKIDSPMDLAPPIRWLSMFPKEEEYLCVPRDTRARDVATRLAATLLPLLPLLPVCCHC